MNKLNENITRLAKLKIRIEASKYVPETELKPRTLRERFFSFPWRPWQKTKLVACNKIYILTDGSVLVTPRVKAMIDDLLLADPISTV